MTERPLTLADLLSLREGWDFEAKAAQGRDGRGALPESFWETYSAMANSEGGLIALGIRERADRSLEVLGLAEPQRVETDLWNLLGNRQKVSANVLQRRHVQWLDIDGRLQQIIEMHGRDLTHLLRSLVEQRMFVPHGDRGGTWYTVAGPDHVSGAKTADLFDLPWDTLQNSDSSAQSFGICLQSPGNSSQSPGDSPQSPGDSPQSWTATDKQGCAGEDARQDPGKDPVAKVSSSRWSPHTEVETAILALCRGEPRTGRQIAEHLNRKAKTIQHNYLPKLVEQGRLKLKYPNEPNHPEQAYRTVSPGEIDQ